MKRQDLLNLLAVKPEDNIDKEKGYPPDRHMCKKWRATLVREYLKIWKVKGCSVRSDQRNIVNITFGEIEDMPHDKTKWPHHHDAACCYLDPNGHTDANRCPTCKLRAEARDHLAMVLDVIFPNHVDRSDSQTDYFDYCWNIGG